jgi:hypothetical protein
VIELSIDISSIAIAMPKRTKSIAFCFIGVNVTLSGIVKLDIGKLSTTINSKCGSNSKAQRQLGTTDEIRRLFVDFQQQLYVA